MFPLIAAGLSALGSKLFGAIKKNPLGALKVGAGIIGGSSNNPNLQYGLQANELELARRRQAWQEAQDRDASHLAANNTSYSHSNANALNPMRRALLSKIGGSFGIGGPAEQMAVHNQAGTLPAGMAMPTGYGSDAVPGAPGAAPPKKRGLLGRIGGILGGGLVGYGLSNLIGGHGPGPQPGPSQPVTDNGYSQDGGYNPYANRPPRDPMAQPRRMPDDGSY